MSKSIPPFNMEEFRRIGVLQSSRENYENCLRAFLLIAIDRQLF